MSVETHGEKLLVTRVLSHKIGSRVATIQFLTEGGIVLGSAMNLRPDLFLHFYHNIQTYYQQCILTGERTTNLIDNFARRNIAKPKR